MTSVKKKSQLEEKKRRTKRQKDKRGTADLDARGSKT